MVFWLLALDASADPAGPWRADDPRSQPQLFIEYSEFASCEDHALVDGVQMADAPELYHLFNPAKSWGTPQLVGLLESTALHLSEVMPEADPLFIGDMSYQRGGPIYGHRKHRGGRDADIGLFATGGQQPDVSFQVLRSSQLDMEANWLLIETLIESDQIEAILWDQSHINAMRAWLSENRILPQEEIDQILPPAGTDQLWDMRGIVRHIPGHRNHLHVRVRCD